MGYGKRPGDCGWEITTWWPDNTDTEIWTGSSLSLEEILELAQEKWGAEIDLSMIEIHPEYEHTDCIGYGSYDPADYTRFLRIKLVKDIDK